MTNINADILTMIEHFTELYTIKINNVARNTERGLITTEEASAALSELFNDYENKVITFAKAINPGEV